MHEHHKTLSVEALRAVCKAARRRGGSRPRWPGLLTASLLLLAGCALPPAPRTITTAQLEQAPLAVTSFRERVAVSDAGALRDLCAPLGPRLGLLQVRTRGEWDGLARVAPAVTRRPDFANETLIGLACWAGTPVDAEWPVFIDAIRVREGGGLVLARFHSGSYLPDGTAVLEIVHVSNLRNVLLVDLNGARFFP